MKGATHNLIVRTRSDVAIYVLNNKRAHLRRLEERFKVTITITTDPTMTGQPAYAIDRGEQVMSVDQAKALAAQFESEMPRMSRKWTMWSTTSMARKTSRARRNPNMADAKTAAANAPAGGVDAADADALASATKVAARAIRNSRPSLSDDAAPEAADIEGDEDQGEQPEGAPMQGGALGDAPRDGNGQENGDRKRRRRGRRGGRRNRRHREGNGDTAHVSGENGGENYERDGADDVSSPGHESSAPAPIDAARRGTAA